MFDKIKKILLIAIVLGLIISGLTMKDIIMDKLNLESNHIRDLRLLDSLEIESFEDFKLYDDLILVTGKEELKYYNKDQENFASLAINDRDLVYGTKDIYLVDPPANSFKAVNLDGQEKEDIYFERKQLYKMDEVNNLLVAHFKKGDFETIEIIDKNGEPLRSHSVEKTSILTYDLDGNSYVIAELNTNGQVFTSEIRSYTMDGELNHELILEEEIVMETILLSRDDLLVQTDEAIYYLEAGELIWERKIDNIEQILYTEDAIYLLYSKTLEVLDMDGNIVAKLGLEKNYKDIIAYRDYIILYGDRNILGLRENKKILEYLYDSHIISMEATSKHIGVQLEDGIDLYEIIRKSNMN